MIFQQDLLKGQVALVTGGNSGIGLGYADALAQAGAELLAVPSAFTRQTGTRHWHVLLRARAIENGAFMASAAQAGRHGDKRAVLYEVLTRDTAEEFTSQRRRRHDAYR